MSDRAGRLSAALADRYRLERELGAGGMATVYVAVTNGREMTAILEARFSGAAW